MDTVNPTKPQPRWWTALTRGILATAMVAGTLGAGIAVAAPASAAPVNQTSNTSLVSPMAIMADEIEIVPEFPEICRVGDTLMPDTLYITDQVGIIWVKHNPSGSNVTIQAFPDDGYIFPPGTSTFFGFSLDGIPECGGTGEEIVIPAAPTVINQCDVGGQVVYPEPHLGVIYTNSNPSANSGIVTITATPDTGYEFPTDAITSWNLDLGTVTPCIIVTPDFSTICRAAGSVDIDNVTITPTLGIEWIIGNPTEDGEYAFQAVAQPGYTFPPGTVTNWLATVSSLPECGIEVTPVSPVVVPSNTCDVGATINITAVTGITYINSNPSATEGTVVITATANTGYRIANGSVTSWTLDLGSITPCDTEVIPIAPTMVLSTECGVGATITIPTQTGVTYINDNPGQTVGTITIRAEATAGYVIPGGTVNGWQFDLPAIVPCDEVVTPLAPTVIPSNECGVGATVSIPTVTGVTYTNSDPAAVSDTVTITATANNGYVFTAGAVTSWVLDLGEIEACDEVVTPIAPSVNVSNICGVGSTVHLPSVEGILYTNENPTATEGLVTVTAAAIDGYTLSAGAVTSWELDLGTITPCDTIVTPEYPTVTFAAECGVGGSYTLPNQSGVLYTVNNPDATEGLITITATPRTGYVFSANAVTTWDFDLGSITPCDTIVTPLSPVVELSNICGVGAKVVINPTIGVTYVNSDPTAIEGIVTITASANDGYVFAQNAITSWELDLGSITDCVEVVPMTPTIVLSANAGNDVCYTIEVENLSGVEYIIGTETNSEGKTVVTAIPRDGYVFADGSTTEWTFNLACDPKPVDPTKPVPTVPAGNGGDKLAVTGDDGNVIVLISGATLLFLMMGIGALAVRQRFTKNTVADRM